MKTEFSAAAEFAHYHRELAFFAVKRAATEMAAQEIRHRAFSQFASLADANPDDEIAAMYANISGEFFAAWKRGVAFG